MQLGNSTKITKVSEDEIGKYFHAARRALDSQPDGYGVQDDYFTYSRISGNHYPLRDFEIGIRFGEGLIAFDLGDRTSAVIGQSGPFDIRPYRARFSRLYSSPMGAFKLLIPEAGNLFIVQQNESVLPNDRAFIQWALHEHSPEAERIFLQANFVIFQNTEIPFMPTIALIADPDMFLFYTEGCASATGSYREPNRTA